MSPAVLALLASRRKLLLALWIGWVALTFALTSIPNPRFQLNVPAADKLEHLAFYGVTGLLFALWRRACGASAVRAAAQAVLFAALVGGIDEAHQIWIPGRTADPLDWIADTAGGACGALLSAFFAGRLPLPATE